MARISSKCSNLFFIAALWELFNFWVNVGPLHEGGDDFYFVFIIFSFFEILPALILSFLLGLFCLKFSEVLNDS